MDELSEDQRVEMWNLSFFVSLGFSGDHSAQLVEWGIDPHDARYLLIRNGEETGCTHEQAMRILNPLVPA